MRKNIWRKWRGKVTIDARRTKIPTENEKLKEKLDKIEILMNEYKKLKRRGLRR